MDKNSIKKFAVWARRELISRVSQRAYQYGITEDSIVPGDAASVNGVVLSADEIRQRRALIDQIKAKGYEQVMEEVAYTWFNRFIALRFMEVNSYLPSRVRVFTDADNRFKPQILTEAIDLELDGLDIDRVFALKDANDDEALFKYLLITQCNALSAVLPGMFQRICDYTELLFPDNLLRDGSVVEQLIVMIPAEDWKVDTEDGKDAVQIIGWLYQFYNIEPKEKVNDKDGRLSIEEIPAATQLFTPDWIVRYMVENSLGRLWYEHSKDIDLRHTWRYFFDEANHTTEIQKELESYRNCNPISDLGALRCVDPCSGSGHILVSMFDLLIQIYETCGYHRNEAVQYIIRDNLWGLEIDNRAAQLSYFSLMMKALQYDRRFLRRNLQPNIFVIQNSESLDKACIEYFTNKNPLLQEAMNILREDFVLGEDCGSILLTRPVDFHLLYERFEELQSDPSFYATVVISELLPFVRMAQAMSQKYDIVVTNPPYLKQDSMPPKMLEYVLEHYELAKYDLYAVFILRCKSMLKSNGIMSMITMHNFMYAKGFVRLRNYISKWRWINMLHLGPRAFSEINGEVVQTCAYCIGNEPIQTDVRICDVVEINSPEEKETVFLHGDCSDNILHFSDLVHMPGGAFGYGLGERILGLYKNRLTLEKYVTSKAGVVTGKDEFFIRNWFEVSFDDITFSPRNGCVYKYTLFSRGGAFDRWYGNAQHIIKLEDLWDDNKTNKSVRRGDRNYYFRKGIGWSQMGGGVNKNFSEIVDCVCKNNTPMIYVNDEGLYFYILGYLNSGLIPFILKALNPTLSMFISDIFSLPFIVDESRVDEVNELVQKAITISARDYAEKEEHWQFNNMPVIKQDNLRVQVERYITEKYEHYVELQSIIKRLGSIFSEIMGFGQKSEVVNDDFQYNKSDMIKRLISYAVGCMFGRYSLDCEGLAYAGGEWDDSKYPTFPAAADNIIPICDDDYFADDLLGRFVRFIETVYGSATLEENLRFIADALGGKGQPREVIRNYLLNDFYADHLKIYQKRPIYWLFDSGKKGGFKALIYMHRYQPDTIARLRTDYVHEQQSRYRTAIADLEQRIPTVSTSERVKLSKKLKKLQEQSTELQTYEEKIHHLADQFISIDLDDGVKKNYAIFGDVLAKIK